MSRHRNLKQYMDDYDDDGGDDFDDYDEDDDDEDDEGHAPRQALPIKPAKGAKAAAPKQQQKPEAGKNQPQPKGAPSKAPAQSQAPAKPGPASNSVLSAARQQSLTSLEQFAKDNGMRFSAEELQKTLDKHNWNQDAAVEELSMRMVELSIAPTQPQSAFAKALDSRPAPKPQNKKSAASVSLSLEVPRASTEGAFDFSKPSPDDEIAVARQRQERAAPSFVVEPTKPLSSKDSGQKKEVAAEEAPPQEPTSKQGVKTRAEEKRDEEDDAAEAARKPLLSLVVIGHVDAGKSTLMGHLLYDLSYVSQKDMHKFEKESRELGKASFKFAWVMDEHAEERSRGVTIDVGIKRFETPNRRIVLLDAPGHKDFVPNMIAGAAQADAAVLVVPAVAGEFESAFSVNGQTKEHAILVHRLGVQKLIVAVNKMDSCAWDKSRFDFIQTTLAQFLKDEVGFSEEDVIFVPCSGLNGENLAKRSALVPDWVPKLTLVEALDNLPPARRPVHKPLRITVAEAYKSMMLGPVTVGGKVESGILRVDDSVLIRPLNVTVRIKAMASHGEPIRRAKAGDNVEIGLASKDSHLFDQLSKPGMILCDPKAPVPIVLELRARINTLASMKFPLLNGSQLIMHAHSVTVGCTVRLIEKTLGADGKDKPRMVKRNEAAQVILVLSEPLCLERMDDLKPLARFLLRFAGATVAAGMVIDILK